MIIISLYWAYHRRTEEVSEGPFFNEYQADKARQQYLFPNDYDIIETKIIAEQVS